MVKCESLRINMYRITHTGKSVIFCVTQVRNIKTSYVRCQTFQTPSGERSYSAPSASSTATITKFLFLMVSFASIPKNVYFLSTVYVIVISQGLHSQLVMRNEGILKNGTEFLMKTSGKKDFSQPSAKKYTGNNRRPSMEY